MKPIHKKIKQLRANFIRNLSYDMVSSKKPNRLTTQDKNKQEVMKYHKQIMKMNGPTYLVENLKNTLQQASDATLFKCFNHLQKTESIQAGTGNHFNIKTSLISYLN